MYISFDVYLATALTFFRSLTALCGICLCTLYNLALLLYDAVITRHNLPQQRLELVYGSQENAGCTELYMDRNNTCAGTSVLNDGITPVLDEVNTSNST